MNARSADDARAPVEAVNGRENWRMRRVRRTGAKAVRSAGRRRHMAGAGLTKVEGEGRVGLRARSWRTDWGLRVRVVLRIRGGDVSVGLAT